MYKCKKCGGINVQNREWVRSNTQEIASELIRSYESCDNDTWCDDCNDNTGIEWVEEECGINELNQDKS